ncbi:MAG: hypothetical protein OER86_04345 [Phycisphaerae bacterium]|nr:hypothetical protein [Phycisphaerae bacterium]
MAERHVCFVRRTLVGVLVGALVASRPASAELTESAQLDGFAHPVRSLAFDHTGSFLAVGSGYLTATRAGGTLRLIRLDGKRVVARFNLQGPCNAVVLSGDRLAAVAAGHRDLRVFDLEAHRLRGILNSGAHTFDQVVTTPDGRWVIAPSRGPGINHLHVWDMKNLRLRQRLPAGSGAVALSTDGRTVAMGEEGGPIRLLRTGTWKPVAKLGSKGPASRAVRLLRFSPDAGRLMAWDSGAAVIWNVEAGAIAARLTPAPRTIHDAVFSLDGARLITAGDDIAIWDTSTGKLQSRRKAHRGGVLALALSPDGRRLASGGDYDQKVVVWNLP